MKYFWNTLKVGWSGRVSRKEYWLTTVFFILIPLLMATILIYGLELDLELLLNDDKYLDTFITKYMAVFIIIVILLITMSLASLAMNIKRFHDMNRSGWYTWLLGIVNAILSALVGGGDNGEIAVMILTIIILSIKGTKCENKYGADPLAESNDNESSQMDS